MITWQDKPIEEILKEIADEIPEAEWDHMLKEHCERKLAIILAYLFIGLAWGVLIGYLIWR